MVRAIVGKAIRLDFGDAKAHATMPELLAEQVPGDVEGVACVKLTSKEAARHFGSLADLQRKAHD